VPKRDGVTSEPTTFAPSGIAARSLSSRPSGRCATLALPRTQSPVADPRGRVQRREAVGKLPGSGDFLYINDKESILSWVISVSEAPLRPLAALL